MTLNEKLEQASKYLQQVLKVFAPKDTGNLSLNAIRIVQVAPSKYQIIIGGEIAPYAVYTNAEWVAQRWAGKVNPNQGWVNRAIDNAKPVLMSILSGAITLTEIDSAILEQKGILQSQLNELAEEDL
jgi:hypothetical protein